MIHEHHARRLHYDLRLELDGVLKSWAVPKGPSMDPADKRLAVHVEDHPFSYGSFEGTIPKGNYGAGEVYIWDKGTYEPLEAAPGMVRKEKERILREELEAGRLKLRFFGEKMRGGFSLSRMKEEKNWLLIKKRDEIAEPGRDKMPHGIKPMLATLAGKPFDDPQWIFEIKWDGYRAIAEIEKGEASLYSRNGLDFKAKYPSIVEALEAIEHDAVLDGEIVAVDAKGKPDFQLMQRALKAHDVPLLYYVFDLLYLDGNDLQAEPLERRRDLLRKLIPAGGPIRFSDSVTGEGRRFFEEAENSGLEGIVAKDSSSRYLAGKRSRSWLKIKTEERQEAVICGFTEPRKSRRYFGSLILGVYKSGRLRYIGHSGGGFDDASLKDLYVKMRPLEQKASPFDEPPPTNMPATWIKPKLVCEVKFTEWTGDGIMRHPIFVGLRIDKKPEEVKREDPRTDTAHELKLTNLDKVYFPKDKITKGDIIDYYDKISDVMLPYLKDRPENLNRHPNGIDKPNFYQKDFEAKDLPSFVRTEEIYSETNEKDSRYIVCDNKETLLYMANLGCIEINPWNSRTGSLGRPDYMIIDLDPAGNDFDEVVRVAQVVHKVLDLACEESYCKTSGKRGLHIFVPLQGAYPYDHVRRFCELMVSIIHNELPEITSLERSPAKRRGLIYLDYLQNRHGQTLCAPYSARPAPGATVSTPLRWSEVKAGLDPKNFTIKTIFDRIKKVGDLWAPVLHKKVDLEEAIACLEKNFAKIRRIARQ